MANGTIQYTATEYSGTYDGQARSISVNVTNPVGTTITYSTDGTNYESTNPSFKDAGTYTVHYRIMKDNYDTITGSKTVTITPLTAELSWGDNAFIYNGNEQAPVAAVSNLISGDACTVTVTGGQTDANEAGAVYTAQATGLDNSNYKLPASGTTKEFTIRNASQTAPSLTGVNESIKGKADGKITGLTTDMEYRIATQSAFIAVTDADMTFAAGSYEVRYAAKRSLHGRKAQP